MFCKLQSKGIFKERCTENWLTTSISVVAMINNTATSSHAVFNNTTDSCPLNSAEETEYSVSKTGGDFDWNPAMQGYILGSSFLGFVISQTPGGMLSERFGAKTIILCGLFLSTLGHLLSPLAAYASSYWMIAAQFLRGFGQGLIPAAHCVLAANWFPRSERGLLNSLVMAGYSSGALISGFSSGPMCSSTFLGGWPSVYYVYGALGLVLCLCFHVFIFESPTGHPRISDAELSLILNDQESQLTLKRPPTPWKSILTSGPVYAVTYAIFGTYWMVSHFLSVQPIFLGTILHFSIQENGFFTSVPFAFQIFLTFTASWVSKWLNTHGYVGVDKVRKGSNLLFSLGYSLCLLGVYFSGCERLPSTGFGIAAMCFIGLSFTGCMIAPVDMSPTFAGSVMGLSSTIGSLAAFIFPVLVGIMTDGQQTLEQWNKIFFMCIGIVLSSGIFFCIFGSAEVQPWNYTSSEDENKAYSVENERKEFEEMGHPVDSTIHL
ncbi:putative inorganic phosphate cotransporter isoform X2 [Argiope bruennichi]|uniref:putative inorganic phosphate cotransporter isoform X2 n=1 Tax=Argiope bruennichi TaxID=94029 RepID=UPI002494A598|nr:putative inorganic phosphate cotransporter isoform X2 [Argiope bruennichi]